MEALEAMAAKPSVYPTKEPIVDEENKIVSTPAYMNAGSSLVDLDEGITKSVDAMEETLSAQIAA